MRLLLLFPGVEALVFSLDDDRHTHIGIVLLERDDVLVTQTDAALASTTRHRTLIVGAAVDADATVAWRKQAQEPVPVGLDAATTILEVVLPCAGILDGSNLERLADWRLGSLHVALALLVALVLAKATRVFGH